MGLGRSKRSDLRRINQGKRKIKYVSNILSGYYYEKAELGTKAARSQLCINIVMRCYANWFNFSAMISLKPSFISSGKKDWSINANHFSFAFANLKNMLFITFSSNPDACIEVTKSAYLILRFLPLRVSANSSVSSGITKAVESISYAGVSTYFPCSLLYNEKFFRCISALPVIHEKTTCSQ